MDKDKTPMPPCAVCAGKVPALIGDEIKEASEMSHQMIWYCYPGDLQTDILTAVIGGASYVAQAHRLRDLRSGAIAELHYCLDRERVMLSFTAPLPRNEIEKDRLDRFWRYAQKLHETRGRERKANVTIEDVFEALRCRPEAGLTWLASELSLPPRTLQYLLKSKGLTLKDARRRARQTRKK